MLLPRRVAAARRVSHERECLLWPQDRSGSTRFLEARFRWRASGHSTGADAEVSDVCCCLYCASDRGRNFCFDCGVFADGDDGSVHSRVGLSGAEVFPCKSGFEESTRLALSHPDDFVLLLSLFIRCAEH
jgi:hypothetical protein